MHNPRIVLIIVNIHLPSSSSIKDKRQIVRSIVIKSQRRYNASVIEIDPKNLWKNSTLAICMIGDSVRQIEQASNNVLKFIEDSIIGYGEIGDYTREIIN